jgi:hypothetical protein
MATYYALSTLSQWGNSHSGGWALSPGGVDTLLDPGQTDDVIFDSTSGSARTINFPDGDMACKTINMSGSNAITLNGSLNVYGNISLISSTTVLILSSQGVCTLTANGATIGTLGAAGGTMTLASDVSATNGIQLLDNSANFNANNFNVTASTFTNGSPSVIITMGSGTWTLTGTGTVWSPGAGTIVAGTSTIKLTNNSSSLKTFSGTSGSANTYNNFWNATLGSGVCNITSNSTFNNIKISAGAIQSFAAGTTQTLTTLTADGTGSAITIKSDTSGSIATLAKSGGGTVNVEYCNIKDITASPASTFRARNSVDQGNNTNWTFVPANSRFLTFL